MRTITTAALLAIVFIGAHVQSLAATFTTDELGISITMTGEITPGDAERLANLFVYRPFYHGSRCHAEAIRIADLVKTLGITVAPIPDGKGACASSCFLIYEAGLERTAGGIDTLRSEGSKGNLGPLGVHRPYFRVHDDGPAGARRQEQVMSEMRAYLVKAGVGHSLIDKMMSHASNDIYWLSAEDIRTLGNFSPGLEEQLISKCGHNALRESNLSARDYILSSQSGALACIQD